MMKVVLNYNSPTKSRHYLMIPDMTEWPSTIIFGDDVFLYVGEYRDADKDGIMIASYTLISSFRAKEREENAKG